MSPNEVFKLAVSRGYNYRCFMCHEVDDLLQKKLITDDDYVDAINDIEYVMGNLSDRIAKIIDGMYDVPRHHHTVMSNVIYDYVSTTQWAKRGKNDNPFERPDDFAIWGVVQNNLVDFYSNWDDREEIIEHMIRQLEG